ncbi:GNAT family N-acetyltransferase [Desulfosporosinus orientis]|uniref:GNAT family N-acetyltransferase n=1 Tax=Desulfosporosinus orientis TaxID=1563 RepID=UPI0013050E5D|nr:GNAT family N-acetyltransferase [Desulfosporosinus orientis]
MDFEQIKGFWDYKPSWQNSITSIDVVLETFTYLVVNLDNTIAGYGIIDDKTGDITQFAVNKENRGKGLASSILAKSGFEYHVGQFEMVLKL